MITRLVNTVIFIVAILLVLTGLRIWLYNESVEAPLLIAWIDSLQFGGNIFNQHLICGFLLEGLLILRVLLGIWELLKSRNQRRILPIAARVKDAAAIAILTLLMVSVISGLIIYANKVNSLLVYATLKNIHTYSFSGLIVLGLIYLTLLAFTRLVKPENISSNSANIVSNWMALGVSALMAAFVTVALKTYIETTATFVSKDINRSIIVDGRATGIEWMGADSITVLVSGGDNFPNEMTQLKLKSFHNFQYIFFLFQWADPEPSYNRSLVKTDSGWIELKSEYSPFGESVYFEDQLAISFHNDRPGCAQSCHLGHSIRAGSHYTPSDTADLWVWKAVSTNPAWETDDGWWGAKLNDTAGGRHFDNSPGGGYVSNLNEEWDEPYFLPSHHAFENWIWMESDRYLPYRSSLDNYLIGATVPGMLVSQFAGDRSDHYAKGQWRNGNWTLEISRRMNTGSPFDLALRGELTIGLAVFDNAEKKHAYHLKPVKLVVEN